ncbi:MAG TPA: prolipoprotein diacylglyceryl transferase [Candidatus Nanoarchaeia archaeon]|nr:prolipoprotein diacylglyceryl transferase [Candidatus Nanoarchaeia archaeon]
MFVHNIDPILFSLGPLQIRWYGLFYALAFIAGYFYIRHQAKKQNLAFDTENFLVYLIIGDLIGARVFEILFYNPSYYFSNPLEMLAIWHGGLSFHGGLLGGLIAAWLFSRKYKIPLLKLADLCSIPLAFGLFIGRIANFINAELVGKITSVPWCVKFPDYEGCRHPTQIYEALKNLFILLILYPLSNKEHKDGYLFSVFLIMYSILRFFIEFLKVPETMFFFLTTGQALNILMLIFGIYLWKRTRN